MPAILAAAMARAGLPLCEARSPAGLDLQFSHPAKIVIIGPFAQNCASRLAF
jgi:hypothetical protein